MSESEFSALQERAQLNGYRTPGAYVAGYVVDSVAERPVLPSTVLTALAGVQEAINAVGRNLNQIARSANENPAHPLPPNAERVFEQVADAIEQGVDVMGQVASVYRPRRTRTTSTSDSQMGHTQ